MSEESAAPGGVGTSVLPGGSAAAQRARVASSDQAPTVAFRGSSDASVAVPAVENARLLPGTVVDRYIVVEHLGSGGLGDVYKAYDPELDRRIAIKILRAAAVEREAALGLPGDRLRREAQALAKLHHPNVVSVHDVGDYGGQLFIAMGFAEGLPLNKWAQANRPGWSRVRDVFLDAGRGLAAAHQAGLVHRDFKPANVVVGSDDSVVVLDFGLARAADVDLDDEPTSPIAMGGDSSLLHREVTGGEVLLGTPAYMAPELFRSGTATQASDQFAFCVALFRVLFGEFPFKRTSMAEYILAVERGEVTVPDADVPRWLVHVLLRGLQGQPDARFPSVEALLRGLEGDRRRRKRRLLTLALAVPLAGVAVGAASWLYRPDPTAEQLAVSDQMARAAREAAARGDFVYPPADDPQAPTALSNVLELEALSGPAAPRAIETASALRSEFSGALIKFGDRYYDMQGGRPFAADFYTMALVFEPDNARASERAQLTDLQRDSVIERARTGTFSEPELAAGEVLSALTEAEPEKRSRKLRKFLDEDAQTGLTTRVALEAMVDPSHAPIIARSGSATPKRQPQPQPQPEPEPEPEIEIEEDGVEPDTSAPDRTASSAPSSSTSQPKRAKAEVKRGNDELRKGRIGPAEAHFHRALEFDRRSFGAHFGLSKSHFEKGQHAKAVRFAKSAVAIRPRSAAAQMQLGDMQLKTLNYAAARAAYQRALQLGSKKAQERLDRLSNRLGSQ